MKTLKTEKIERKGRILPLAPLDRLIRKSNAERVSESAAKELGIILEQLGEEIARRATDLAKHANRSTVKDSDIRLAYKQWLN
ncbi:MAG: histone family protein [Promethearchaeota archaeon]